MKKAKSRRKVLNVFYRRRQTKLSGKLKKIMGFQARIEFPGDPDCEHDWQRDGQTLTGIRWTCAKCLGTFIG